MATNMRLAAFIRSDMKSIVSEWENFAQTLTPAADRITPLALRDHIKEILTFIANDIESSQTDIEQVEKSRGDKPNNVERSAAETHASLRHADGFNMDQMVSEYRALRASVTKLWRKQLTETTNLDISDLVRFNESIDQALTESICDYSKKLDHSRNLFLGILSHDLRSPLGAAQMSAELTLMIGPLNDKQTMLVSQVVASMHRAIEIVTHLLDITRTRLGSGLPIIKNHMDMGFVAKLLVNEMRAAHPNRIFNLETIGDLEGELDKARIGQVFSNLLGNAVQYGFTNSPINIKVEGNEEEIILSVHNEGIPIPLDIMGKIFDSMIRGEIEDNENQSENQNENPPAPMNLGLGLYITKEIVTAHGGTISVKSSQKEGTIFTARFPRSSYVL